MNTRLIFSIAVVTGLTSYVLPTSSASAGMVMFQDTTFQNTDWVATKWADTSAPPATFTATQVNVGGNPTDYRETTHNYGGGSGGAILVEHRNVNFNWTPSNNVYVSDIDFSYDLNHLTAAAVPGAVGYALNVYQGGNVYRHNLYDNIFSNSWTPFSHLVLPLSAFWEVAPGTGALNSLSNPAGNLPMSFGYMSANSANGITTKVSGIDNLKITLWTIPEPTTAAILVLGGICFIAKRNRQEIH